MPVIYGEALPTRVVASRADREADRGCGRTDKEAWLLVVRNGETRIDGR